MNDVLADSHAIVWFLADPSRLSPAALAALTAAQNSGRIWVATITFVELTYLVEKGKLDPRVLSELWTVIQDPTEPVEALPLTLDDAAVLDQIPRGTVPDMPDRIISATALAQKLPLISADSKIRSLTVPGLTVIW
ncbi:MAG: type II toxin-antitoxin system VapC family toxin [Gemmataceae bacterium]|nr:type II toxin-antitoxin system VapC family toxin [Gemmataceae bacterium]